LEEHEKHLAIVLERIMNANRKLKKTKCNFFKEEIEILGYKVNSEGIQPTEDRISCVRNFPLPTLIKELRSFMGLMFYCRDFIQNLAALAAPLSDLLIGSPSTTMKIELNDEQVKIFNKLKTLLNVSSKLALPNFDKPFIVITDASSQVISGILAQESEGKEKAISFFIKKLNDSQAKYSATQLELLAVIESLTHFKPYLIHKDFVLRTDHQALQALKHTKSPDSMLFR
jgi:hypothetical protein